MIVPEWFRLILYMLLPVLPVWADFMAKSTDYSFRGLAMPIISSLTSACAVLLARTRSRGEPPARSEETPPDILPAKTPPRQLLTTKKK